jgi:hypothetical protein
VPAGSPGITIFNLVFLSHIQSLHLDAETFGLEIMQAVLALRRSVNFSPDFTGIEFGSNW